MPRTTIYSEEERKQRKKIYDNKYQKSTHYKYMKKYYQKNKDKIVKKLKERHNCFCGGRYAYYNKIKHFMTNKHRYSHVAERQWLIEQDQETKRIVEEIEQLRKDFILSKC